MLLVNVVERSTQPDPFQYWNLKVLLFAFAKIAMTWFTGLLDPQSTLMVEALVGTTHPWAAVLPSFPRAWVAGLADAVATPPADASATLVLAAMTEAESPARMAPARTHVI